MNLLRTALLITMGIALVAPAGALAYEAVRPEPPAAATATVEADSGIGRVAAADPRPPRAVASPRPEDPASVRSDWLRPQISELLEKQATALKAGDRDGFLAPADAGDTALRGELTRRFNNLRALEATVYDATLWGAVVAVAGGGFAVPVRIRYCFVVADCNPLPVVVETRWTDAAGRLRMLAFNASPGNELGPRPWEVSDLRVAVGTRVVVATTPRYASRLPATLVAAERAAAAADRFAHWGKPPGRYVVYLAGAEEWGRWYSIKQAGWVAGYAMPLTDTDTEIVLNAAQVDVRETAEVLRHEFAHVVTLNGVRRSYERTWWLVEGIAEYVRAGGQPVGGYDALSETRRFINSERWSGDVALDEPGADATAADANGRYGVAYLAVRRLAERYGEPKMIQFFTAVAREGKPLEEASTAVFGVAWAEVSADCQRFVRRLVN